MSTLDWTPPDGMPGPVVTQWRTFYRGIRTLYGITPTQYRALYLAQLGRCYICHKARGIHPDDPKGHGSRRLGVDHNHVLGNRPEAVRGLLCTGSLNANTCNRMIGRYPIEALRRAVAYVEESPAQTVFAALAEGLGDRDIQGLVYRA